MYFLHASLGVAALVAATAHKFLSPSADHLVETTGDIAWYLAIIGIIYAIVFMSGWLVDRFKLLRQIKLKLSIICSSFCLDPPLKLTINPTDLVACSLNR